jgi:transcriptional regulator with XRE-family HTH domain
VTQGAPQAGFSYQEIVREIRAAGLSNGDIARAAGVKERQVQHWAAGSSRPRDETRDRLVDTHYVVRLLGAVYRPEGVEIWMHAKNPAFEGARPIDLLAAGDFQPVVNAVERFRAGAM